MHDRIKNIQNQLLSKIENQMSNLDCVDTEEFAKVIDAVHHLEEAMYYCAIVEAMEKSQEDSSSDMPMRSHMGYTEYFPHGEYNWDAMDWRPYYYYTQSGRGSANQYGGSDSRSTSSRMGYGENGMMGYSEGGQSGSQGQGGSNSSGQTAYYGGPTYYYTDSKPADMKDVSKYLSELSDSLPHMMEKASPEEKKMVSDKLQQITQKVTGK